RVSGQQMPAGALLHERIHGTLNVNQRGADVMSALPKRRYTLDEYFALERDSSIKHEYLAGEILMMAGSSPEHDRIVGDVQTSLNMQLRGRPCETFTGDMRVRASADSFVYPDLSVVCGEAQFLTVDG